MAGKLKPIPHKCTLSHLLIPLIRDSDKYREGKNIRKQKDYRKQISLHQFLSTKLFIFTVTACGLGLLPFAPGTWGTVLGAVIHVAIVHTLPLPYQLAALVSIFLFTCILCYLLTPWSQRYWNSNDPGRFVLDEVAGYLLVPILFHHGLLWQTVLWGFLFFRFFDIIKLPPARQIDNKTTSAWGILLDDLVSSLYAVIALYIVMWISRVLDLEQWLIKS
jgi:phosphatidylglycerophosphatase A